MITDPYLEAVVAFGLLGAVLRWLRRSRRVTPPSWFMVPVEVPAGFRVLARPFDWEVDDV